MKPTNPQAEAGILIEPPISVPVPIGVQPKAKETPVPPEEPPGENFLFHGFFVIPCKFDQVVPSRQNSGVVVLKTGIQPALINL